MNENATRVQSRKRLLMAGVCAVVLIPLVLPGLFSIFSSSRLNQRIAELRSQGLPTNAVELNAYYSVPPDVTDTSELWIAATTAVKNAGIEQRVAKIPIVGLGPTPVPEPGEDWAELEISRTFLKDLDRELQLIRQAADAEGMARYPDDVTSGLNVLPPELLETLVMLRLLILSSHVHVHDGQDTEVLKDVAAIFAVSDSLRAEPLLVSQLYRISVHDAACFQAIVLIPHCQWTDEELQKLQIAIGRARFREEMVTAFHGELANCLSQIDTSSGFLFRDANKLKAIELFAESIEGLESSWLEATKRQKKIGVELKTLSASMISRLTSANSALMLPALRGATSSGNQAEARQNCAIVTMAAYRYRLQHGALPASLTDLKDLIPGDASEKSSRIIDPFDGQSLRFTSDNGRLLIYSIGYNKVDDGGDIATGKPQPGDLGYSVAE